MVFPRRACDFRPAFVEGAGGDHKTGEGDTRAARNSLRKVGGEIHAEQWDAHAPTSLTNGNSKM